MIETLFLNNIDKMTDTDIYIWKYISKNMNEAKDLTIVELADKCNVSRTTILRFCKKLGLSGYKPFKVYLQMQKPVEARDAVEELVRIYQEVINIFSKKDMTDLFENIYNSKNIYMFSKHNSSSIQEALINKFFKYKKFIIPINHELEANVLLNSLNSDDFFICICLEEIDDKFKTLLENVQEKEIPLLLLSNNDITKYDITVNHHLYLYKSRSSKFQDYSIAAFEIAVELIAEKYGIYLEGK